MAATACSAVGPHRPGLNIKPPAATKPSRPIPSREKEAPVVPTGPCSVAGRVTDVQLRQGVADTYVVAMPGACFASTDAQVTTRSPACRKERSRSRLPGGLQQG